MRNPNRIDPFTEKLRKYWKETVPDWRFGQLMSNFLGFAQTQAKRDIFFIEDDEMEKLLDDYFSRNDDARK